MNPVDRTYNAMQCDSNRYGTALVEHTVQYKRVFSFFFSSSYFFAVTNASPQFHSVFKSYISTSLCSSCDRHSRSQEHRSSFCFSI